MQQPSKYVLLLIIGNEFCERFCYYGFRALLFQYLRETYGFSENKATGIFHLFNFSCYFFTFIGGLLSDNLLGRYRTILYLSILYLVGTIITTISTVTMNLRFSFIGLLLISIGTGGIKPCVSTFGGDQFDKNDVKNIESFFSLFYFAINSGSLISIFISPLIADRSCFNKSSCYPLAFGLPSMILGLSLVLFICGNKNYIKKNPNPEFFLKILDCMKIFIKHYYLKDGLICSKIISKYGPQFYTDLLYMFSILKMFALLPFFWMIYDQQSTSWVEQASKMNNNLSFFNFKMRILPSQMQALNGILILILIPLFTRWLYPAIKKSKYNFNSLKKMGTGILFVSLSFFLAALVEGFNDYISILWQFPQYLFLTVGEIFLSMTGIEFVYQKSPPNMKGIIFSLWLMTVALGNLYVIMFTSMNIFRWMNFMSVDICNYIFYGVVGLVAAYYFHLQSKKLF